MVDYVISSSDLVQCIDDFRVYFCLYHYQIIVHLLGLVEMTDSNGEEDDDDFDLEEFSQQDGKSSQQFFDLLILFFSFS